MSVRVEGPGRRVQSGMEQQEGEAAVDSTIEDMRQRMESEASENAVRAAGLSLLGSEEALIAQMTVAMDKMARNARDSRQASRELRSTQRRAGIADQRKAARRKYAAGILGAVGGVVSSAVGSQNEGLGTAIKTGVNLASNELEKAEADANADAQLHELVSQEAGELAGDEGEAVQSIESFQDKARGHLEQIQRARMEARMAALRG